MKQLTLFLLALFATSVAAVEYQPYPTAHISVQQWHDYYTQVKEDFGATEKVSEQQRLVTYSDKSTNMSFAFTMPGHEALPAWVARHVTESNGSVNLSQIGYYAGDEEPFAVLFQQYEQINERIRAQFRKNQP